jgi:hypothetical protein
MPGTYLVPNHRIELHPPRCKRGVLSGRRIGHMLEAPDGYDPSSHTYQVRILPLNDRAFDVTDCGQLLD